MKSVLIAFCAVVLSLSAHAEEGEGHEEKKPPPKPLKGSPLAEVLKLPAVAEWKRWTGRHNGHLMVWGESVKEVAGVKYWDVAVGDSREDGMHVLRRFCVPQFGGDILVESISTGVDDPVTYTPYAKWVEQCQPTDASQGKC